MATSAENSLGTIGIMGGSFNPPHLGHVLACHYALARWKLERILVVPSFTHPFGKPLEAFEHRLELCRLAFKHLDGWVEVSAIEEQLGGVSYTIDTVREIARRHPDRNLALVVGSDLLEEVARWKESDELNQLAPLLVIPRIDRGKPLGSAQAEDCVLPDISSSRLREELRDSGEAQAWFPAEVWEYIKAKGLYRESGR